jgi:hypothetical protein
MQIAMWSAAGLMMGRIASKLAPNRAAACATAALFLLSPELMAFSHFFWGEMVHLVFVVTALWLAVCHARHLLAVAASGVLFGLALLTKLLLVPLAPLFPVCVAFCAVMPWRARLGRALLLGTMIGVTLAPTALTNRARYGVLMPADSSALALWLGLSPSQDHPRAVVEFFAAGPDMATRNAVYRRKIRTLIDQQGILGTLRRQLARQYFMLLHYETWFTRQLPGTPWVMRGRYHIGNAIAAGLHLVAHLAHAILLFGAALGIVCLRPRAGGWWNALLLFLLYNVALFLVSNVNARYFVQMMPAAMLFAGVGLSWVAALTRGRALPPATSFAFTRPRLVAGVALAVLLEFLAFRDLPMLGL